MVTKRRAVWLLQWHNTYDESDNLAGVYGTYKRALAAAKVELGGNVQVVDGWVFQSGDDPNAPAEAYLGIEQRVVQ